MKLLVILSYWVAISALAAALWAGWRYRGEEDRKRHVLDQLNREHYGE